MVRLSGRSLEVPTPIYLFLTPDRGKINKGDFNSSLVNSSRFLFCDPRRFLGSLTGRDYSQHCLKRSWREERCAQAGLGQTPVPQVLPAACLAAS